MPPGCCIQARTAVQHPGAGRIFLLEGSSQSLALFVFSCFEIATLLAAQVNKSSCKGNVSLKFHDIYFEKMNFATAIRKFWPSNLVQSWQQPAFIPVC